VRLLRPFFVGAHFALVLNLPSFYNPNRMTFPGRSRVWRLWPAIVFALIAWRCGSSPTNPSPVIGGQALVLNNPPVIVRVTVQGTRTKEPANFADLGEDIPIAVDVTDAETAATDLKFNWSASAGTFAGTGSKVTWRAPSTATTPTAVTIGLEVVETYSVAGKAAENRVKSSTTISLHDSAREVAELARQFLLDFSDSSIKDVPYVMRNFEPTCYGTQAETSDVSQNRASFTIVEWKVEQPVTTVNFGGICPFRNLAGDACAQVRAYWKSVAKTDLFTPFGEPYMKAGQSDVQNGVDQVAAMYYAGQQRWRLCDSAWQPDGVRTFRELFRGLVP